MDNYNNFELSGDAHMFLDDQGFVHCNDATLKIFDCPSRKLFCTKHPSEISPEFQPCGTSSWDLSRYYIDRALQQNYQRFEWVHQRLTGIDFQAEVLLSPAEWQGRDVLQAVVRDISVTKCLEKDLKQAKEKAEKAAMAQSEFLAMVSHEIRTPMHGIIGAQEILLNSSLSQEQNEMAMLVLQSAKRLLNTLGDVLDISKIEADKLILDELSFSSKSLLEDVYSLLKPSAEKKGISLKLSGHDVDYILLADPSRLRQILINIVSNAVKFTSRGGVSLNSALKITDKNKAIWQLQVDDTGVGMNVEQQSNVFAPFCQADSSTSRHFGGTGLGLSISRALTELMGGEIRLHSEPCVGSCFSINIPVTIQTDQRLNKNNPRMNYKREYKQRVLVAEDNCVNQKVISKQLQHLGLDVCMTTGGYQAVQAYIESRGDKEKMFAMILMDVQMPGMNGIEATEQLRQEGCTLPIIALTADVLKETRQRCLSAGMNHFIGKPFDQEKLIALLDEYLL